MDQRPSASATSATAPSTRNSTSRILPRISGEHGVELGPLALPERQRTIRSTIEWSTQLLGPSERELLTRLGLFAGGFSLDAAEWIADGIPGANTLDDLGALVDGSLVRQQDRGDRAAFSMLSIVREYALDQLDGRPDAAALRDRHAAYYVRLGERAEFEIEGATQRDWIARLVASGAA